MKLEPEHIPNHTKRQTIGAFLGLVSVLAVFVLFAYWRHDAETESTEDTVGLRDTAKSYLYAYRDQGIVGDDARREKLAKYWTSDTVFRDLLADDPVTRKGGDAIMEYHVGLMKRCVQFKMWWEKILVRDTDLNEIVDGKPEKYVLIQGVYRRDLPKKEDEILAGSFVLQLKMKEIWNGTEDVYVVTEHNEYLDYGFGKRDETWRSVMVGCAYVLWSIALILMIVKGFREKVYGMPVAGSATMLGMCFLTGWVGPWLMPHLFFPKENEVLLFVWRFWALLLVLIFGQYLLYHKVWKFSIFIAVTALSGGMLLEWGFITFYQDYYVNELSPIVVLAMALAYPLELKRGSDMRGMTATMAWLLAVGTFCLYYPVVHGDMKDAYPYKHHGYEFIYTVYAITIIAMIFYALYLSTHRVAAGSQASPQPAEEE